MRIKRIQINNYRAFLINGDEEAARYTIELPDGENLLIYGENGSGKSSLFKALRELFVSATDTGQVFQKNLFYDEAKNSEHPFIGITLEDDSEHFFSAETAKTSTYGTPVIAEANIAKGFISYRDLLKLHFRQEDKKPDLFSFFLGDRGLFAGMIVPAPEQIGNKISFSELWKKVQEKLDKEALSDYNINIAGLFQELEKKANLLLEYFHKECDLKIVYRDGEIIDRILRNPEITFSVSLFGKEISEHDEVLNEARLTALAISVYLAHVLSLPATDLRILFLDDIFIGLDMTNRIPLVEILTHPDLGDGTSFQSFQIFLTTYDREWFNVAKTYLGAGWHKAEFYVDNHSSSIERPLIRKSDTYKERAEFHFIHGDYPACANYLRKAFEQILRNILPENVLYTELGRSEIEGSQVVVSKQHSSIKENDDVWYFLPKATSGGSSLLPRPASLHALIDAFKTLMNNYHIAFPFHEDLKRIKNRLLNPLSHDDLRSPVFKKELESGFLILDELQKVKSKILIDIPGNDSFFLFFDKEDTTGDDYRYKFQLMENLRYLEYGGIGRLLKAECRPISRTSKLSNKEEAGESKNQKSIFDLCRGVCIFSAPKEEKDKIVLDESALLHQVYTESGKTLSHLL